MKPVMKNISELLCDIASKLITVLSLSEDKHSLQIGSLNFRRETNVLDMVSSYIRPEIVTKYGILNNDLTSINPWKSAKIRRLVHKYYNKTIALPLSRIEIKMISHEVALHIKKIHHQEGKASTLKYARVIAPQFGLVKPTKISGKLLNPNCWRKSISNMARKHEENLAIELELFNSSYCSSAAKERHAEELAAKAAYLNTLLNGDEANIKKAHAINAKLLMHQALTIAKIRGLINLKNKLGLHAIMITFTCPPKVRKGNNIEACFAYLTKLQNKLTTFRSNHNLSLTGLTSIEPHNDGYPHMHTYIVGNKEDLNQIIAYSEKLTRKSPSRTLNIIWEDSNISDLGFYVAKSILYPKFELDAWYRAHNQRRVNYFGLPADEVWNDLRKKPLSCSMGNKKLRAAQLAAKNGDYATFCLSVGGLALRRKDRPYKILYRKHLDAFNDVTRRKIGIIVFGRLIPKKHVLHTVVNIVKTKFPRCINFFNSHLKYYDTVGLRAPPLVTKTQINLKEQIKRLKL